MISHGIVRRLTMLVKVRYLTIIVAAPRRCFDAHCGRARFDDVVGGGWIRSGNAAGVPARQSHLVLPVAPSDSPDRFPGPPPGTRSDRDGGLWQAATGVPLRRSRSLPGGLVRRARPE